MKPNFWTEWQEQFVEGKLYVSVSKKASKGRPPEPLMFLERETLAAKLFLKFLDAEGELCWARVLPDVDPAGIWRRVL